MLLKVAPGMRNISANEDMSLADITSATLINMGTYPVKWGFGDGVTLKLEEGQSVALPSPGTSVYTSTAVLRVEFEKPEVITASDYPAATLIFNRLTDISSQVGKMIAK